MTKINAKITGKLPVWLAIPAAIILAGLILFFVLGFQPAATVSDSSSLVITHDAYVNADDSLGEQLQSICEEKISAAKLKTVSSKKVSTSTGGEIEYVFSSSVSEETLTALWNDIETALQSDETLSASRYTGSVHVSEMQYGGAYIGRAAIAASVALALAFIYVAIRYRLSMGLSTLIVGIFDVAAMLALTVILRIPVTPALATVAIFATFYSVLVSMTAFNKIRALLKSEEFSSMPAAEAVEKANAQSMKNIWLLGGIVVVFLAVLSVFGGSAIRVFALPAICGVVMSTYSGTLLAPSLVAAFAICGENVKAKRAEKARLAKQQEEEAKAQKRAAKKD